MAMATTRSSASSITRAALGSRRGAPSWRSTGAVGPSVRCGPTIWPMTLGSTVARRASPTSTAMRASTWCSRSSIRRRTAGRSGLCRAGMARCCGAGPHFASWAQWSSTGTAGRSSWCGGGIRPCRAASASLRCTSSTGWNVTVSRAPISCSIARGSSGCATRRISRPRRRCSGGRSKRSPSRRGTCCFAVISTGTGSRTCWSASTSAVRCGRRSRCAVSPGRRPSRGHRSSRVGRPDPKDGSYSRRPMAESASTTRISTGGTTRMATGWPMYASRRGWGGSRPATCSATVARGRSSSPAAASSPHSM